MSIIDQASELDFRLADLPVVAAPDHILMADPAEFDVLYAINAHMRDEHGELLRVDRDEARRQWWCLRETLEGLGLEVDVLAPLEGFPDLVFCANQCLPVPSEVSGAQPIVIASNMASEERAGEVPHVVELMRELGYQPSGLKRRQTRLEGMGDGLWHPGRRLLWAGVGPRSERAAWEELAARFDLEVVALELLDEDFYHLDTALAMLDETSCLWFPGAFTPEGRALVEALFAHPIAVPEEEARHGFACNAFCPDRRHVLIQRGNAQTKASLEAAGFEVLELETGEFMKSGGSVFCMKLLHGPL